MKIRWNCDVTEVLFTYYLRPSKIKMLCAVNGGVHQALGPGRRAPTPSSADCRFVAMPMGVGRRGVGPDVARRRAVSIVIGCNYVL